MLLEDGEARTRRNKLELVDARPSNAARCCYKTKVTKREIFPVTAREIVIYTGAKDHLARPAPRTLKYLYFA